MSQTPFAYAESLRIGMVDFVSPDEVKVALDIDAPDSVALNAGGVRPFPRVNGYVLMPVDDGYLVGQIEWLTIERSAFPQRRGMRDFGLVDLPFPARKMSVNPLGTLRKQRGQGDSYVFRRGSDALPSIGGAVLLPTETQLRSIVESGQRRRVRIGTSPLAGNAEVAVDPDRLFGRHVAVLGNTGSGKSCSVAGLVRWSLEAARQDQSGATRPNARFIVLDPNGEYSRAFRDETGSLRARIFSVRPKPGERPLRVPLWLWNNAEWVAFSQASTKTQKPALVQALRFARGSTMEPAANPSHELRRFLRTVVMAIRLEKNSGSPWASFPRPKAFFEKLERWRIGLEPELVHLSGDELLGVKAFVDELERLCEPRRRTYPVWDFSLPDVNSLLDVARQAHSALGGAGDDTEQLDADTPRRFTGSTLIRCVEAAAELMNVAEHVETLLMRMRSLLADTQMRDVIADAKDLTLETWLADHIGADEPEDGCLTILDLSMVPSEVVHVIAAVSARMIFEALQRYRKVHGVTLPTVLVMEEAHTFVKRYSDEVENHDAAAVCCQVFERIAREGRKFGLGLVISSQRPSELSTTVLSQCNSFLLHRLSNDRDQDLVHRFVPDNLRGLLKELPSLPSQTAILLGWASELPILVRMNDLPKNQQPHSEDPDFWAVWTGRDEHEQAISRNATWKAVVEDWLVTPSSTTTIDDELGTGSTSDTVDD